MRIQDIYSSNTVHIPLSCTLQEVAQQMRQKYVGALIATGNIPSGPRTIGVVMDRDMVLDAVTVGVSPLQTCVADVIGRGTLNVPLDTSLSDALQEILSSGVQRAGVTSGGVLAGVLLLDDMLGVMATELGLIARLVHNECERETTGSVQPPLSA